MGDANWKNRAAAVEAVGGILASAGFRIAPNTGDLMPALGKRFADSNRNLAANALAMAGKAAAAIGPAVAERRHGHGLAAEMTRQMGDSKPSVRAAAAGALDAWVVAAGLEKTLPVVADKMVDLAGKMSGDGKADALAWTLRALAAGDCGDDADVLAAAVAAAAVGLADNKAQARAAGGRVMDEVLARVGPKRAMAMSREMTAPAAMKAAAAAHVDKNKADFVAGDGPRARAVVLADAPPATGDGARRQRPRFHDGDLIPARVATGDRARRRGELDVLLLGAERGTRARRRRASPRRRQRRARAQTAQEAREV